MHYKMLIFLWESAVVLLLSFCCVTHLCGSNAIEQVMSFE